MTPIEVVRRILGPELPGGLIAAWGHHADLAVKDELTADELLLARLVYIGRTFRRLMEVMVAPVLEAPLRELANDPRPLLLMGGEDKRLPDYLAGVCLGLLFAGFESDDQRENFTELRAEVTSWLARLGAAPELVEFIEQHGDETKHVLHFTCTEGHEGDSLLDPSPLTKKEI